MNIALSFAALLTCSSLAFCEEKTDNFLTSLPVYSIWMKPGNERYPTFKKTFSLMNERNSKTIVETGTTRGVTLPSIFSGDGGSSLLFASWATKNNAIFYSVDICPTAFSNAAPFMESYASHFFPVRSDSVEFLENFDSLIDVLYLDSYDFDQNMPGPSQEHHLKEIIAAYPKLHKNSIVLIDDCGLPHGGKGPLAIKYLLERNWKIVISSYQVLLTYGGPHEIH